MTRDRYIRDRNGNIVGYLDGAYVKDKSGNIKGRYDESDGFTRDRGGTIVGQGDLRVMLMVG